MSETSVPEWSGKDPLLRHRLLIVSSSEGRGQGFLRGLCYKVTNPIHEGFAVQRPNSKLSHWASGFQHMNGGDTNTQTIAHAFKRHLTEFKEQCIWNLLSWVGNC